MNKILTSETIPQIIIPKIIADTTIKIMIELVLLVNFIFLIKVLIKGSIISEIIKATKKGI